MLLDVIDVSRVLTQANLGDTDDKLKVKLLFFWLCILKTFESIGLTGSRKDSNGIFRLFSTAPLLSASQLRLVGFPGICNCKCYLPEGNYYSCLLLQTVELMTIAQ